MSMMLFTVAQMPYTKGTKKRITLEWFVFIFVLLVYPMIRLIPSVFQLSL